MRALTTSIHLPVTPETAFCVFSDLSTLLRLSPFFTLTQFELSGTSLLQPGISYAFTIELYDTGRTETHHIVVDTIESNRSISFAIREGALKSIHFAIEPSEGGVELTQTLMLEEGDETVMVGSQKELDFWMRSVGEYLKLAEGRSSVKKLLRCFMDRIWLKMTLSERNIAIIITKISILEIVALLVVVMLWNLFLR